MKEERITRCHAASLPFLATGWVRTHTAVWFGYVAFSLPVHHLRYVHFVATLVRSSRSLRRCAPRLLVACLFCHFLLSLLRLCGLPFQFAPTFPFAPLLALSRFTCVLYVLLPRSCGWILHILPHRQLYALPAFCPTAFPATNAFLRGSRHNLLLVTARCLCLTVCYTCSFPLAITRFVLPTIAARFTVHAHSLHFALLYAARAYHTYRTPGCRLRLPHSGHAAVAFLPGYALHLPYTDARTLPDRATPRRGLRLRAPHASYHTTFTFLWLHLRLRTLRARLRTYYRYAHRVSVVAYVCVAYAVCDTAWFAAHYHQLVCYTVLLWFVPHGYAFAWLVILPGPTLPRVAF